MCVVTSSLCVSAWGMEKNFSNWNPPAACKGHLLTFHWKQQTTCQNLSWIHIMLWTHHGEILPSNTFTPSSCWSFQLPLRCCHLVPELSLSYYPAISSGPSGHDSATLICFASTLTSKSCFLSFLSLLHFLQLWLLRPSQLQAQPCIPPTSISLGKMFMSHLKNKMALRAIQQDTLKNSAISTMTNSS